MRALGGAPAASRAGRAGGHLAPLALSAPRAPLANSSSTTTAEGRGRRRPRPQVEAPTVVVLAARWPLLQRSGAARRPGFACAATVAAPPPSSESPSLPVELLERLYAAGGVGGGGGGSGSGRAAEGALASAAAKQQQQRRRQGTSEQSAATAAAAPTSTSTPSTSAAAKAAGALADLVWPPASSASAHPPSATEAAAAAALRLAAAAGVVAEEQQKQQRGSGTGSGGGGTGGSGSGPPPPPQKNDNGNRPESDADDDDTEQPSSPINPRQPQPAQGGAKSPDYYANVGDAIRTLREDVPRLFERDLDYRIYRDDVVFRDPRNAFSGIKNYKLIFWSLRFHGRLFFSKLTVEVRRVWQPDDGCVRVRWTVRGVPRVPWEAEGVFDGVSTYKLDRQGMVYEHQVDNVILRDPPMQRFASPLLAGLQLSPQPQPMPGAWGAVKTAVAAGARRRRALASSA